jgi:hypothetical protein
VHLPPGFAPTLSGPSDCFGRPSRGGPILELNLPVQPPERLGSRAGAPSGGTTTSTDGSRIWSALSYNNGRGFGVDFSFLTLACCTFHLRPRLRLVGAKMCVTGESTGTGTTLPIRRDRVPVRDAVAHRVKRVWSSERVDAGERGKASKYPARTRWDIGSMGPPESLAAAGRGSTPISVRVLRKGESDA